MTLAGGLLTNFDSHSLEKQDNWDIVDALCSNLYGSAMEKGGITWACSPWDCRLRKRVFEKQRGTHQVFCSHSNTYVSRFSLRPQTRHAEKISWSGRKWDRMEAACREGNNRKKLITIWQHAFRYYYENLAPLWKSYKNCQSTEQRTIHRAEAFWEKHIMSVHGETKFHISCVSQTERFKKPVHNQTAQEVI